MCAGAGGLDTGAEPRADLPSLSWQPLQGIGSRRPRRGGDAGLLVAHRPAVWPLVFAVDESTWARCDAETSPERGFYYSASTHSAGQPIVAGWSYQWITQLDWACDSWTAPMDATRIPPGADGVQVTATQIRDLTGRLGQTEQVPVFVFHAGYDPIALTYELAEVRADVVVRIRDDRVFYTDPAQPTPGTRGRPRRHGNRRGCAEPDTWPAPDHEQTTTDDRYGTVHVAAWHDLHPQLRCRGHWTEFDQPPIVSGTVVRVDVQHLPKPTSRTKKTLWLWVAGPAPDLDICWRAYLRRFDIEHTFRFVKNTLGWTTPSVRTPEQADRWTWHIVAAYTQLRLPVASSKTNDCPENAAPNPDDSPPPASEEDFDAPLPHWARQPVQQNPKPPDPDAPGAAAAGLAPAIWPSRRPPN